MCPALPLTCSYIPSIPSSHAIGTIQRTAAQGSASLQNVPVTYRTSLLKRAPPELFPGHSYPVPLFRSAKQWPVHAERHVRRPTSTYARACVHLPRRSWVLLLSCVCGALVCRGTLVPYGATHTGFSSPPPPGNGKQEQRWSMILIPTAAWYREQGANDRASLHPGGSPNHGLWHRPQEPLVLGERIISQQQIRSRSGDICKGPGKSWHLLAGMSGCGGTWTHM